MLYCSKCESVFDEDEVDTRFCPDCGTLLEKKTVYSQRIHPQPITIYSKRNNVPYGRAKYQKKIGSIELELDTIADKLDNEKYRCETCNYYFDGECTQKKGKVKKDAICKSFEPK